MSPVIKSSRRQFLRGAGGFTLALPFMTSLMPRMAFADYPYSPAPRFVGMCTGHGGVFGDFMFPADSALTQTHSVAQGHLMRYAPLLRETAGELATISDVVRGAGSQLTQSVASKMNLIRGLDLTFYMGHHWGATLGNFAENAGNISEANQSEMLRMPTIDQVMAWSPDFYRDLSGVRLRSMHVGATTWNASPRGREMSWGWSSPSTGSGDVVPVLNYRRSLDLFDAVFNPEASDASRDRRLRVVDQVFQNYRQLRTGAFGDAARLSDRDRQRLDDHMDRLSELERRLEVVTECDDLPTPTAFVDEDHPGVGAYQNPTVDEMVEWHQAYNDVLVAAFLCGASRIATIEGFQTFHDYTTHPDDWHNDSAHASSPGTPEAPPAAQVRMVEAQRNFFEGVFLDLASKLDVEEANGITCLDNSLLFWTQESGQRTHSNLSIPVVTAGSAAGFLETGMYFDYRNLDNTSLINSWDTEWSTLTERPGLSWNQWLGTCLQAVGVQPAEFEIPGQRGYGTMHIESEEGWPAHVADRASEVLPLMRR